LSRANPRVAPPSVSEWEPPGPPPRVTGKPLVVLALALPLVPLALAAVRWGGYTTWLAVGAAVLVAGWVLGQRRIHLSGAGEASPEEHSRFVNIAKGLSADLGRPAPRLYVSPSRGPNALVLPRAVVITKDLLDTYTRTELEAVIAHCLVRLADGGLGWALVAAAVGGGTRWGTPPVDLHVDARAAAMTRYPPALASAIEKATRDTSRAAALWFVGDSPAHASVKERVAELRDL
jgi:Peptidase family M48